MTSAENFTVRQSAAVCPFVAITDALDAGILGPTADIARNQCYGILANDLHLVLCSVVTHTLRASCGWHMSRTKCLCRVSCGSNIYASSGLLSLV